MAMRHREPPVLGFMLCAALSAASTMLGGCGRPESVADRQLAEMREQVTKLEAETDKLDRSMGPLEAVGTEDKLPSAQGFAAVSPPAAARVVQLGGPSEADPADPNDPSARTELQVPGQAGASTTTRPRSGKSNARARVDDSDAPDARPEAARSSALDPDAKKAYETALAQVQARQYDKGLEGLNAFLVRWPDHPYAENAMYWRGEAYFSQGEYLRAAEQFDAVIARFSGSKAPDALLKLGMCHDRLGSSQRAREYWDRLRAQFPRSDAAKKIPPAARDAAPGSRASSGDNSGAREDTVDRKGPKENR
ncbi:MAG: tol-pal system protein YbgF [Polyangiales bacterium]